MIYQIFSPFKKAVVMELHVDDTAPAVVEQVQATDPHGRQSTIDVEYGSGTIQNFCGCDPSQTTSMGANGLPITCCDGVSFVIDNLAFQSSSNGRARYVVTYTITFDRSTPCNERRVTVSFNGGGGVSRGEGQQQSLIEVSDRGETVLGVVYSNCSLVARSALFVVPGVPCCTLRPAYGAFVLESYDSGTNTAIWQVPVTFVQNSPSGCEPGPVTVTGAALIGGTQVVGASGGTLRFSASGSGLATTVAFTDECGGTQLPDFTTSFPSLPCCKGNVVITSLTPAGPQGSGNYDVSFRFETTNSNCIPVGNSAEYLLGTPSDPGYTNGTISPNTVQTVSGVPFNPAGDTLRISISYGCDGTNQVFDFPVPPDPPCCTPTITIPTPPSVLSSSGGIDTFEYEFEFTEPGGCTTSLYDVYIDGALYLSGVTAGTYWYNFDAPEGTPWNNAIAIVSQCSGATYRAAVSYTPPPCCPFLTEFTSLRVVSQGGGFTVVETIPTVTVLGVFGCVNGPYFIWNSIDPTPQPFTSGTPHQISIPDVNRPSSLQVFIQGCDETPASITFTTLPPPCCTLDDVTFSNPTILGSPDPQGGQVYNISVLFRGGGVNNCIGNTVQIRGLNFPFGPFSTVVQRTPLSGNINIVAPAGLTTAEFLIEASCTGQSLTRSVALPARPCCIIDMTGSLFTGYVAPTTTTTGVAEFLMNLNAINNPIGCQAATSYQVFIDAIGYASPILPPGISRIQVPNLTAGVLTLRAVGNCGATSSININLPAFVLNGCCNFYERNLNTPYDGVPTGNPNEYTVQVQLIPTNLPSPCPWPSRTGLETYIDPLIGGHVLTATPALVPYSIITTVTVTFDPSDAPGTIRRVGFAKTLSCNETPRFIFYAYVRKP